MKAIEIAAFGGPEVLQLCDRPLPAWSAGEVLIRVHASGVNRPDILQRIGAYPPPLGASDIPGLEVAGVIEAGDPGALSNASLRIGDRVCALVAGGGYAQWCIAPVVQCLPVPSGFSFDQAASLPETFFTVWSNVFERGQLSSGETLLVQGGGSGIGVAAVQLAKVFGASVIATVGSAEKVNAVLNLGADSVVNYRSEDFEIAVQQLTGGRGVDVILDMVAGDYVEKEVRCLAEQGRLVIIAVQGGVHATLDAGLILRKRLTITGSTLRARSTAFKGAIAASLRARVWPLLESGRIQAVVHTVFAADQAHSAHRLMESNQHIGKIVLNWEAA